MMVRKKENWRTRKKGAQLLRRNIEYRAGNEEKNQEHENQEEKKEREVSHATRPKKKKKRETLPDRSRAGSFLIHPKAPGPTNQSAAYHVPCHHPRPILAYLI